MKGVIVGCSIFGIILLSAVGVGLWFFLFRVQPLADATLSIPSSAEIDHPIEMVVTTSNPHAEPVIVDSIDISDSFLEGFQVRTVEPAENETMDVPFVDQRAWIFSHTLAPGASKAFTFTLNPVLVGHYSGDVDVCNPNQDFNTLLADVVIRTATTGPEAGKSDAGKDQDATGKPGTVLPTGEPPAKDETDPKPASERAVNTGSDTPEKP